MTNIAIISNFIYCMQICSGLLVTYLYYKTLNKKDGPEVAVSRTPKCTSSELKNDTMKFVKLLGYRFIRYLYVMQNYISIVKVEVAKP